jgi:hypothetical protein
MDKIEKRKHGVLIKMVMINPKFKNAKKDYLKARENYYKDQEKIKKDRIKLEDKQRKKGFYGSLAKRMSKGKMKSTSLAKAERGRARLVRGFF